MQSELSSSTFPWTWDEVTGWCRACRELSPTETAAGVVAIAHLRKVFGEDFSCFPPRLFANLLNQAGWIYRWLDWLSRSLRDLESCRGFDALIARLVDRDRFEEALSVLETADRFFGAGFSVSFDVPVRIGDVDKVPDLHVVDPDTRTSFDCEISVMYRSHEDRKAAERSSRLFYSILNAAGDLTFCGRLLRVISDARTEELATQISEAIAFARDRGCLAEVIVPQVMEFAVAPSSNNEILAWCRARDLEPGSFGAPMPQTNELRRLQVKIEQEEKQLPSGQPNALVIHGQDLFNDLDDPVRRLHDVEEVVLDHPKIALLVVCADMLGHQPPRVVLGPPGMFVVSNRGDVMRHLLVVENRRCASVAPDSVVRKLRLAFTL